MSIFPLFSVEAQKNPWVPVLMWHLQVSCTVGVGTPSLLQRIGWDRDTLHADTQTMLAETEPGFLAAL